jgi:CRISPR-associated endonuclease/helicase Cas3
MVNISPSSDPLLSHIDPDRLLGRHLRDVAEGAAQVCTDSPASFLTIGLSDEDLEALCYLLGVCHDFGKATSYFQEYIKAIQDGRTPKKRAESNHGGISALFASSVMRSRFSHLESPLRDILPYIAYEAVRRHHGDLHNSLEDIELLRDDEDVFSRQITSMDLDLTLEAYSGLLDTATVAGFFQNWREERNETLRYSNRTFRHLRRNPDPGYAGLTLFCYSALLSADKEGASGLTVARNLEAVRGDLVDRYRERKNFGRTDSRINEIRNAIYAEVTGQVGSLDLAEHIFSLNLPTGTGKTLTGLSLALKLRERIERERGFYPRIVYCLPYLSIIDQNVQVFEEVLGCGGASPSSEVLLTHHHLTELSYRMEEGEYEPDDSQFLIEGWNAEVIVTTFVQFFSMLFSRKNRAHRKYHRAVGGIVILDEVQTLPHRYWELIRRVISRLADDHGIYFILMTATQPHIFKAGEEIRELAPGRETYFHALDRLDLYVRHEPVGIMEFIETIREDISAHPDKDFLIVMNTIASSQQVFRALTELTEPGTAYVYLSTRVVPRERLSRIRMIKEREQDPRRRVIVSTQLIEAGVDIDVDVVYRDFAPLDSVNQVAGRCNRNFGRARGVMHLFEVVDERGVPYSRYIYRESEVLLQKTRDVLEGKVIITEAEFVTTIEEYYADVGDAKSDDLSKKLLEHYTLLEFEDLDSGFNLIDTGYPKCSVFVALDERAEDLWDLFRAVREIKGRSERRNAFLAIRKGFYDYVITVPSKFRDAVGYDEGAGIGYISSEEVSQGLLYDLELGFHPPEEDGGGGMLDL